LLEAVAPYVDALAMTNSIAATVRQADGQLLFDGQRRGICGAATLAASIAQVSLFAQIIRRRKLDVSLIGVGGAESADDFAAYLAAGADAVHIATAAMVDPQVALKIKAHW
jgi:dihydroorotate dehydrogenase